MTDSTRYILSFILILGVAGEASGCRFRSPSVPEQQELIKRGAFPAGTPAWVSPSATGGTPHAASDGLIHGNYGAPTSIQGGVGEVNSQDLPTTESISERQLARAKQEADARRAASAEPVEAPSASAIDRIVAQCPTVEAQVNDALTTVDTAERIRKYETLIARCPRSSDLMFWLGRDYYRSKNLVDAGKYLERAVVADRSNDEAKKLLEQVRAEQNK